MKTKDILKTTTNSRYYKMMLKWDRENQGKINCSYCPYHGGENGHRHNHRDYKNWKKYRKHQYKAK